MLFMVRSFASSIMHINIQECPLSVLLFLTRLLCTLLYEVINLVLNKRVFSLIIYF